MSAWLTGWDKRKIHKINPSDGAGINYQMKLTVYKVAGFDSGGSVYLNENCEDDFGDVRFTEDDGKTEIPYWIESYTSGVSAIIWVKVPHDLDRLPAWIHIYYDKSGESTTSNFDDTFIFGDPFDDASLDTTRWPSVDGGPTYSIDDTNHYLEVTDLGANHWYDGVGFHSRTDLIFPSKNWKIESAYGISVGFDMYHKTFNVNDMFGAFFMTHHTTYSTGDRGIAFFGMADHQSSLRTVYRFAGVGGNTDYDSGGTYPGNPYQPAIDMKKVEAAIKIDEATVQRVDEVNYEIPDRIHYMLIRQSTYPFGTVRLYAFKIRRYIVPEPVHSTWGTEETFADFSKLIIGDIDYEIKIKGTYGILSSKRASDNLNKTGSLNRPRAENDIMKMSVTIGCNSTTLQIADDDIIELENDGKNYFYGHVKSIDYISSNQEMTLNCECPLDKAGDQDITDSIYIATDFVDSGFYNVVESSGVYTTAITSTNPINPPLTRVQTLITSDKCITPVNSDSFTKYITITDNGAGVWTKAYEYFFGKPSRLLKLGLRLEVAPGSIANHNLAIEKWNRITSAWVNVYNHSITTTDIPSTGILTDVVYDVNHQFEGGAQYRIVIEETAANLNQLRWYLSETERDFYGAFENNTITPNEDTGITNDGTNYRKGSFLFELEYESDWRNAFEHYWYKVVYGGASGGTITWGGDYDFIPCFENITRKVSSTTYEITRLWFSPLELTTKVLCEKIVNDFGRNIFKLFDVSGMSAGRKWSKYQISDSNLLKVLQDIASVEKIEFHTTALNGNPKLVIEDQVAISDWAGKSAAYKAARTFKRGEDTSTDSEIKVVEHGRKLDGSGKIHKAYIFGPEDEILAVLTNFNEKPSDGYRSISLQVDDLKDLAATYDFGENVLTDYRNNKIFENVDIDDIQIDDEQALNTTNELIYIEDGILGVDEAFKVRESTIELSTNWIVKTKIDNIVRTVKLKKYDKLNPNVMRNLEGFNTPGGNSNAYNTPGAGYSMPTSSLASRLPTNPNLTNVAGDNDKDYPTNPENRRMVIIDTDDLGCTWGFGSATMYIAVGEDYDNREELTMESEIERREAKYTLYREPDGTWRVAIMAVFPMVYFSIASIPTAWPWRIKEVAVTPNQNPDATKDNGTATSSTNTTLTDTTKAWGVNAWADYSVKITGGTGAGQTRRITSNTATRLTITPAWDTNPSTDSTFQIGECASRTTFWVPDSDKTIERDKPALANYHPIKYAFSNDKLYVIITVDEP